jgi:hypothetical protein
MKRLKKYLSIVLTMCMVLTLQPTTARADVASPVAYIGSTGYTTLTSAMAAASNNEVIQLVSNITEAVSYTDTTGKTVTIDGGGYQVTAPSGSLTNNALTLSGIGTVILKNVTLQGGDSSVANSVSTGLAVEGIISVQSYGTVSVRGGAATDSYGLNNSSTGTVDVTHAYAAGVSSGIGVYNSLGTVNVSTATGNVTAATGGLGGTGVRVNGGTVNVTTATGSQYGVFTMFGVVNVTIASVITGGESSIGVFLLGGGMVNAGTITGDLYGTGGMVNVKTVTGNIYNNLMGYCTVYTGTDVTSLILNAGTGTSCVLDSVTVVTGSAISIGTLPNVYKGTQCSSTWYTDSAKASPFSGTSVTGAGTLYSSLYIPDTTINTAAILGVTAPVTGETPVASIADTEQYTASVTWSPDDSAFKSSTVYTATVTITPKSGYTLSGVGFNFFTIAGATTTNLAGSGVVTAVFPETIQTIESLAADINAVTGLTASINGSTVTVTGDGTVSAFGKQPALTLEIPSGVTVVWKAALTGQGITLLELTGDGTFEVADGANIVNDDCRYAIDCSSGLGSLMMKGGSVSTTIDNSVAINMSGQWKLTMTGGTVSASAASSIAIMGKNPVVITGGTVSATDASGYQFFMAATSVYRSGIIDTSKIAYNDSNVFVEVRVDANITQVQTGTSTGLTATGHNLSTGDSVTAVWAKQNGEIGVNISYYSAAANAMSGTTEALETWFLAVPGITVIASGTGTSNSGNSSGNPAPTATPAVTSQPVITDLQNTLTEQEIQNQITNSTSENVNLVVTLPETADNNASGNAAQVLPAGALQAAEDSGRDLTVTFADQGGNEQYSWTFDHGDLAASENEMTDVDLSLNVSSMSQSELAKLGETGDSGSGILLDFAYDGLLPAQASVRIYVGNLEGITAGSKVYLYHVNEETGKLETLPYSSNYSLDSDGYLTINIVHCSDYAAFSEEVASGQIISLRNQISVVPTKKTLYLGVEGSTTATIEVTLPATLEVVSSLEEKTSQSAVAGVTISYASDNTKVATVDQEGHISAVGKGKTYIITTITLYSGKIKTVKTAITVK